MAALREAPDEGVFVLDGAAFPYDLFLGPGKGMMSVINLGDARAWGMGRCRGRRLLLQLLGRRVFL